MRRHHRLLFVAVLAAAALPAWGQDKPRDDATRKFFFNPDSEINASELLAAWGKTFNALVIEDQQVGQAKIKFVTGVQTELSWGATKKILDFYDVMVVEDQPTPNGPWVIRAHSKRNIGQKEPPPWRYVDIDSNDIPDHDEIVTAVFKIKYGAGNAIFATIRGLATRDTSRVSNSLYVPGPEVIIISDLASRVRYYARVVEALDVQGPRKEMKIYQIEHAPVEELAQILTAVLQALAGSGAGGGQGVQIQPQGGQGGQGAAPTVIADPRSNRLIVAAFPDDLRLVELVKSELDVRVAPPTGRFHVYKCKDADAEYLAGKIQELFTGQAAARPSSTSGGGGTSVRTPGASVSTGGGGGGVATLSEAAGVGDVDTRIVADERTNSLLIQAEERAYEEILAVLSQLDKKRRRVLIEAQVWEVSEPDSLSIGFELASLTNAHDGSLRPSAATGFGGSSFQPVTNDAGDTIGLGRVPNQVATGGGGTFGVLAVLTKDTFDQLPIIASALATHSETRLITRPFTITNDNTPATFSIIDRVPYQTQSFNNVNTTTGVEFVEARSQLNIEPQVNSADNLTLKVTLELTSFGDAVGGLPPGTNSRTYEGEVTMPNNRYMVFGGLERETENIQESKVPFLGDIPILGHLFKNWSVNSNKAKLYIFIRPTIFSEANFSSETRLADTLRQVVHIDARRDEWLPPVVPDSYLRAPGFELQDEALEVFGTGSADPVRAQATWGVGLDDDE